MAKREYPPVRRRAKVYKGAHAATRLKKLDPTLTPRIFASSFDFGIAEANQTLETEPILAFGSTRFYKTSGMLRANLRDVGWQLVDQGNHALAVNEGATIAIVVCSGDENVGIDDPLRPEPQPRNPKGPLIRRAVETNIAIQDSLGLVAPNAGFPLELVEDSEDEDLVEVPWPTWFFLYTQDELTGAPRGELSLPDELCISGAQGLVRITGWVERIFVESFKTEPIKGRRRDAAEENPIVVPVERRVG